MYVCNNITQKQLAHLEDVAHEALWIWLRPNRLPRGISCIIAAVLYIPPHSSAMAQPDMLTTLGLLP